MQEHRTSEGVTGAQGSDLVNRLMLSFQGLKAANGIPYSCAETKWLYPLSHLVLPSQEDTEGEQSEYNE